MAIRTETTKEKERKVLEAAMARYVEWVAEGGLAEADHRTKKLRALANACEALHVARKAKR